MFAVDSGQTADIRCDVRHDKLMQPAGTISEPQAVVENTFQHAVEGAAVPADALPGALVGVMCSEQRDHGPDHTPRGRTTAGGGQVIGAVSARLYRPFQEFDAVPENTCASSLRQYLPRCMQRIFAQKKAGPNAQDRHHQLRILITNPHADFKLIKKLAKNGGSANWPVLKTTIVGDHVLLYMALDRRCFVATAQVLSKPRKKKKRKFRADIGRFVLLTTAVTSGQTRTVFPHWGWPRFTRSMTTVPDKYVEPLLKLLNCSLRTTEAMAEISKITSVKGGGFGNPESNALVEKAAVKKVTALLESRQYTVVSRERERIGYDLDATKVGAEDLHVEVKGSSGKGMQFIVTEGERTKAASDPLFWLMIVTNARTKNARIREFSGRDFSRLFGLTPVSYIARMI